MESVTAWRARRALALSLLVTLSLAACGGGGGTGTEKDSGTNKTYLSVDVADAEGDALQYQWRVTSGTVENRIAKDTVWTMPDGPGLHFAYVVVSDGKGGYASQQYAVSSDTLGTSAPTRVPTSHTPPALTEPEGTATRVRFVSPDLTLFATDPTSYRRVYLPDVQVSVTQGVGGPVVFAGASDLSGEVKLPKLATGGYQLCYATVPDQPLGYCTAISVSDLANANDVAPPLPAQRNLRLYGHVALSDGSVCGAQDEFFSIQSAATVQLLAADGSALSPAMRVNRFGDYALDAAVPVKAALSLAVKCEGYSASVALDAPTGVGYTSAKPVLLSHVIGNQRPSIVKMVASGPDGNVRGKMIVPEADASSNGEPGSKHFLTYKGLDTRLGACMYYRSLGAVAPDGCDAQGNMSGSISFDDWKRLNGFKPTGTGTEVSANYINKRDLNLVRQMVATQLASDHIAFYVCNHPGPLGTSQQEVDDLLTGALNGVKLIACVAMEWSVTLGVNGNNPFTKFFTFAPDGRLLASVNLDGRGEKYLPGACVACHGGSKYNGKFPEKGASSAHLGANFLPFDTNNYLLSSDAALTEAAQSPAFFELNRLVQATELSNATATYKLVKGWYNDGTTTLNKAYVPPAWDPAFTATATAEGMDFYRQVVGTSCRTCHTSLGAGFDWDTHTEYFGTLDPRTLIRFCGGKGDVAINASMPNALITHDRLFERARSDPALAGLMQKFLGCSAPSPDPVYPAR